MQVVLATWNAHKVEEVTQILKHAGADVEVVGLEVFGGLPEAPETGATFAENALQKARFVFERVGGPDRVVVADDSGLVVDALNGAPGVHSKRFTPEATAESNNQRLLTELTHKDNRAARFVCVMAVVSAGDHRVADGWCEGHIAHTPRGDGGFGYDPLFVPEGWDGRTLAQASAAEKNAISHRGRAFRQLPEALAALGLG